MNTSGSTVRIVRVQRPRRARRSTSHVPPGEVLGYVHRAVSNFDILGLAQGAVVNTSMLISLFRQPPSENHHYRSNHAGSPQPEEPPRKNRIPLAQRISRFLEDRRVYGPQPHFLPELAVLGVIVIVSIWPMLSLVAAMETLR